MTKVNWGQASVAGLNKTVLEEKKRLEQEKSKPATDFEEINPLNQVETQKTITSLNSRSWYRAVKILYFIFVSICYVIAIASTINFWFFYELEIALLWVVLLKILIVPWSIFWAWFVSKVPQWIFYYIYFGSIKPLK